MLDFDFVEGATYVIAVTFGPDSMALLDMIEKRGVKPVVCFINYHTSESTEEAETAIRQYCQAHDLVLEVCDTNFVDQTGRDDDYGVWGRKVRYDFFKATYVKYNAAAIFIAHQQDDLIESYLTTKREGVKETRYGWSKISTKDGMIVARPLLNFSKEDLVQYDKENNVPYLPDILHFNKFTQKQDIHDEVLGMTEIERGQILDEIRRANDDKLTFIKDIDQQAKAQNELDIRSIIALNDDEFTTTLVTFINKHAGIKISVTPKMVADIRKMCLSPEPNKTMKLKGTVYMVKEYDIIGIDDDGLDMPYSYVVEKPGKFSCETFDLDFSMGAEDRNIHPEDYPLTVRSVLPQDSYIYGGYLVPVRRMLVAAGISPRLLHVWPIFLNKDGKIIYVPRYKKGFSEYHTSVLNIHVKNDEK